MLHPAFFHRSKHFVLAAVVVIVKCQSNNIFYSHQKCYHYFRIIKD